MGYTLTFEIGRTVYPRRVVVDDMKTAWQIDDYIDDALQDLVENVASLLADAEHPMPDDFGAEYYNEVDVGGLRDAVILAAQDVMKCELAFDYPI